MIPIILDLDRSAASERPVRRLDCTHWHDVLRFGCSTRHLRRFSQGLKHLLPAAHGPVLLGSGDFHHLSLPLIERLPHQKLRVIVFDNHPDNMRFPFGIHCGSWVRHAASLPNVDHVHVIGMTSPDMARRNAWSHYLAPLRRGKVRYWTLGADPQWPAWMGVGRAMRAFASPDELVDALAVLARDHPMRTYVSVDKDVLSPEVVQTNWDQGILRTHHLASAMRALSGQIVGADITGELSQHRYRQRWKRVLSALDGQSAHWKPDQLAIHQARQQLCNDLLLDSLARALVR